MPRYSPSPADPAVRFVYVGWADDYDSETEIIGGHKYLGVPGHRNDCSEMHMYVPVGGQYHCGIGRGKPRVKRFDVVFVAKDAAGVHRIVAVYFKVCWYPAKDDDEFIWVRTKNVLPLRERKVRSEVKWPRGQGMRRWAYRAGVEGREHDELYRAYRKLLCTHRRTPGGGCC